MGGENLFSNMTSSTLDIVYTLLLLPIFKMSHSFVILALTSLMKLNKLNEYSLLTCNKRPVTTSPVTYCLHVSIHKKSPFISYLFPPCFYPKGEAFNTLLLSLQKESPSLVTYSLDVSIQKREVFKQRIIHQLLISSIFISQKKSPLPVTYSLHVSISKGEPFPGHPCRGRGSNRL